jgi:hypothetical protein
VSVRVDDLLARIESSPCDEEELVRRVVKKLRKQVTKARRKLAGADRATRDSKVAALVSKAQGLLGAARTFLGMAAQRGLLSQACAATLAELVGEVELCVTGLPTALSG